MVCGCIVCSFWYVYKNDTGEKQALSLIVIVISDDTVLKKQKKDSWGLNNGYNKRE